MTDPEDPSFPDASPELEGLDPAALMAQAETPAASRTPTGRWQPPALEELTGFLAGYEITALLGRGGMGAVYRGTQLSLEREVAIKLLPAELGADPEFQARFRREAKAMARLNHANIVQIYDFGQTAAGHYYFVMEFVDGTDLHRMIRDGQLDVTGALNAVSQICDALQYAHDMGFVHRDIKPANIFINRQGILKVGDFGLAKLVEGGEAAGQSPADLAALTGSGVAMGTLNYIAPEQLTEGCNIDRRADIYSLGVMFYEMLTREVPRGAVKEPSKRVAMLDVRIDGVVFKAMDPNPDDRYQSAVDLRTDVDVIRTTPAPASEPSREAEERETGQPTRSRVRVASPSVSRRSKRKRSPVVRVLGVGILLALVLGSASSWFARKRASDGEASSLVSLREPAAPEPAVMPKFPGEYAGVTMDAPFTNSLGMSFIPLPGTGLLMCRHETRKADYAAYADEEGGVGGGWWKNSVTDGVPVSNGDDHPVVNVNWEEAVAFCEWLSRREGRAYRLPSDREWSLAAGIAHLEPAGLYPEELNRLAPGAAGDGEGNFADLSWSRTLPNRRGARNLDDRYPTTAPVMSFRPNALGFHDLAGNVWEHTGDFYDANRVDVSLRGNCWNDSTAYLSGRTARSPSARHSSDGFRCVLVAVEKSETSERETAFEATGQAIRFGLSRYQMIEGASTWAEARAEAERRGGHLATFGTAAERDGVVDLFGEDAFDETPLWIGGHGPGRTNAEGWRWVTEEHWSLTDWPGTPSGPEAAAYQYAALARSGAGGVGLSAVPAAGESSTGRGFLIEWDDLAGDPPYVAGEDLKVETFTNSLGMKFVPVPGTDVYLCIHETRNADYAAFAAENPGFYSLWRNPPAFEGTPVGGGGDHPLVMTSWYEARAFCDWLSRKEGRTYRLPTDREWSVAAGLGDLEAADASPEFFAHSLGISLFPWGINLDIAKAGAGNFFDVGAMAKFKGGPRNSFWKLDDGHPTTAPVMSFLPNRLGIYDLHGNVWELCEDRIGSGGASTDDRSGTASYRVRRGGSWSGLAGPLSERGLIRPDYRGNDVGFRVALAVKRDTPPLAPLSERTRPIDEPLRFGSSRYQFVEGAVTWGEARARAEQMGGRLATLAFEAERKWVEKEFGAVLSSDGSSFWIGMLGHNGKRWITGELCRQDLWLGTPLPNASVIENQLGGVLARAADGRVGWDHRPLAGGGSNAPGGFLVEWDDLDGEPLPKATTTTSDEGFTNSLGMRFLPVEGSDILLCVHETRHRDYAAFAGDEASLDEKWENASFEGIPMGQRDDDPVVNVNWHEARAFCDWLSRREGRTYRLPTDREWSLAAGLGEVEPAELPPLALGRRRMDVATWGADPIPPPGWGNFADAALSAKLPGRKTLPGYDDGHPGTSPAMSFPAFHGFHDLDGNVYEWVEDRHPDYPRDRFFRGSSWGDADGLFTSRRQANAENTGRTVLGFRCAVVVEEASPDLVSPEAPAPSAAPTPAASPKSPSATGSIAPASTGAIAGDKDGPFFLGRWYQSLGPQNQSIYLTEITADGRVSATAVDGRRSGGTWEVSDQQLVLTWENGVKHHFDLSRSTETLQGTGEGGGALPVTVTLTRNPPANPAAVRPASPAKPEKAPTALPSREAMVWIEKAKTMIQRIDDAKAAAHIRNDLALAYAAAGFYEDAASNARRIEDPMAGGLALLDVAVIAARHGRFDEAVREFKSVPVASCRDLGYAALVSEMEKAGNTTLAAETEKRISGRGGKVWLLADRAERLYKENKTEDYHRSIDEARQLAVGLADEHEIKEVYKRIVVAQVKCGDVAGAKETTKSYRGSHFTQPMIYLIGAQADMGDYRGAHANRGSAGFTKFPSSRAAALIARAQAAAGKFEEARATARSISYSDHRLISLVETATTEKDLAAARNAVEGLLTADHMDGIVAERYGRTLAGTIPLQAELEGIGAAVAFVEQLDDPIVKTLAYLGLARFYCPPAEASE